jgi:membrane protease YdiL (CAAX protease family)
VLRDLAGAAAIVAVVYALGLALWELRFDSRPGLPPEAWALWLLPALAAVALQTGAEELVFRGYLQSQLAARFASPFAWAVAPSLLFGAVHWDPGLPLPTALAIMGSAALFGLIAADLTARTGSIGAAWGLHLANNAFALLVLATPGSLPGLALRLTPYEASDPVMSPMLLGDVLTLLLVWALCRRALAPPAQGDARRGRARGPAPASRRGA